MNVVSGAHAKSWESEAELYRLLAENVRDYGIFVIDGQRNVVSWTTGAQRLLGYTSEEILGRSADCIFTPEDLQKGAPAKEIEQALKTGRGEDNRWHVRKDGTQFWSVGVMTPLWDDLGALRGFAKIMRDQTDRKLADDTRRETEERLKTLLDNLPNGAVYRAEQNPVDGAIRFTFLSAGIKKIIGVTPEEGMADSSSIYGAIHKNDVARVLAEELRAINETGHFDCEFRIRHRSGQMRWIHCRSAPNRLASGAQVWEGVLLDVTDRKLAEQALSKSEKKFRHLYDSNIVGIAITNADGSFEDANDEFLRIVGYDRADLEDGNINWRTMTPAEYSDISDSAVEEARTLGVVRPFEKEYIRKDGTRVSVYLGAASLSKTRYITFLADLTSVKKAERTTYFIAQASEILAGLTSYESTLEKVATVAVPTFADWCAVDLVDDHGQLRQVAIAHNDPHKLELIRELASNYPPPANEPYGRQKVIRTGESELMRNIPDTILATYAFDERHLQIIRDLALKSYICVPIVTRHKIVGAITFATAESGRRYDEKDLVIAEDLARRASTAIDNAMLYREVKEADRRKDEFLAMLAHELRNPLAPIRTGLDVLALLGTDRQLVDPMRKQIEHLVRLVDDLLDVSRIMRGRVELRKELVELSTLIERSLDLVRPLADAQGHTISLNQWPEPVWLDADPVRLTQAITNLITNAVKYTPTGGVISVSTTMRDSDILLSVQDNGIGIEAELLPKVFELFTQAARSIDRSQGGLGIGLTVVKSVVEMHGGEVAAESAGANMGSKFTMRLPTVARSDAGAVTFDAKSTSRKLRILIVDDNIAAAQMLETLLKMLGSHETMIVHEGRAVLAAASRLRPDLILLDIGLPGMTGYDVARLLRQRPEFHHAFLAAVTGYGTEEDRRKSLEVGFDDHTVKPLTIETIEKLLLKVQLRMDNHTDR